MSYPRRTLGLRAELATFLAAFVVVWTGLLHVVHAQTPEALIDEGVTLREEGRDAEALERFQRAYELTSSGHALAQIALAEQALGRWTDAYDHLTAALASGDPWVEARRSPLEQSLARIDEHVGRLELVEGVEGAEVRVNGEVVGTLPLSGPVTVPVGTVVLEVRAAGHVPMQRTLQIRAGARARERIVLVPTGEEVASTDAASPSVSGGSEPAAAGSDDGLLGSAIGAYAVAGVGAVVMAAFGGLTIAEHGALSEGCGATSSCTPSDVADANTFALVSDIGLGVALAGAVVGTVLLIVGLSGDGGSEEQATLTPWFTADGGGAAARVRF